MLRVAASPDFVPHEVWDRFAWLVPHETGPEPWYYAAPHGEPPTTRQLPSSPDFIKSVDPALRPLVLWLHQHGISTGPSCAGHAIDKRGFREIYTGLEQDADRIRTAGLVLHDPEDDRDYLMQDESYQLPWGSFDAFRKVAYEHQPTGWLPFYTTDPRVELTLGTGPGFEIKETGSGSYGVRTSGENPEAWKMVSDVLRRALS